MLAFLLAILLLAFSGETSQTWYFAQLTDSGEIAAISASGTVNRLQARGDLQYGVRLDGQTALFLLVQDGESHWYRVTPEQAVEIPMPGNGDALRQALAASGDHVVLRDRSTALPSPAVLVDAAAAQALPLTGRLLPAARFSADGQSLRYLSFNGEQWSLIERTLATGAERVLYSFASRDPLPSFAADSHGERWLLPESTGGVDLLTLDGAIAPLNAGSPDQPMAWTFLRDDLVGCGAVCTIQSPTESTTLALPADTMVRPLAEPQAGTLLALDDQNNFWLLSASSAPLKLGSFDPLRIFMPPSLLVSPDGRYLAAATGDRQYTVWDLITRTPAAQLEANYLGQVFYSGGGFTAHVYDQPDDQAVLYANGKTVSLPHPHEALYVTLMPDGGLLCWLQTPVEDVGDEGIYRYDPADQTYTPLLLNARLLVAHAVN